MRASQAMRAQTQGRAATSWPQPPRSRHLRQRWRLLPAAVRQPPPSRRARTRSMRVPRAQARRQLRCRQALSLRPSSSPASPSRLRSERRWRAPWASSLISFRHALASASCPTRSRQRRCSRCCCLASVRPQTFEAIHRMALRPSLPRRRHQRPNQRSTSRQPGSSRHGCAGATSHRACSWSARLRGFALPTPRSCAPSPSSPIRHWQRPMREMRRHGAAHGAARCMGSRTGSRTSSTPQASPRRGAQNRGAIECRPPTPWWCRACETRVPSWWRRPQSARLPTATSGSVARAAIHGTPRRAPPDRAQAVHRPWLRDACPSRSAQRRSGRSSRHASAAARLACVPHSAAYRARDAWRCAGRGTRSVRSRDASPTPHWCSRRSTARAWAIHRACRCPSVRVHRCPSRSCVWHSIPHGSRPIRRASCRWRSRRFAMRVRLWSSVP